MRISKTGLGLGIISCTLLGLCGCAPVTVPPRPNLLAQQAEMARTALVDKQAYLAQNFSLTTLATQVQDTVVQAGAPAVSFDRLQISRKERFMKTGADAPTVFSDDQTYENAGNGMLRMVSTAQSNGFEMSTNFILSYRGLWEFRNQRVSASATSLPPISEVRSISHFSSDFDASQINFTYSKALAGGPQIYSPVQISCAAARTYRASVINPAIDGVARELVCRHMNSNGIVQSTTHFAYLDKYGIALMLQDSTLSGVSTFDILSFKAE